MRQRTRYIIRSAIKALKREGLACPSCGNASNNQVIARKHLVTRLKRCDQCQLLFRTPTTRASEDRSFYQNDYSHGSTTDCPTDEELSAYIDHSFENHENSYAPYVELLVAAGAKEGTRLFEFGCSWGYGSWQFAQAGFEVESYEISTPRAEFAKKKLGVKTHSSLADVQGPFDIFFSSHVLEHVPSVQETITFGMNLLRPGGLFIALTPNGSQDRRAANPESWEKSWGFVHPNLLDDQYYQHTFDKHAYMLTSPPYSVDAISNWSKGNNPSAMEHPDRVGPELLLLVKK